MLHLRLRALAWAHAALALLGCTSDPSAPADAGSSSGDPTSPSTTLGATSSSLSTTSTTDSTSFASDTFGTTIATASLDEAFMGIPDYGSGDQCDVFAQDCPQGTKCMPRLTDRGVYDWWCSPLAEDPAAVGEPCHADTTEPPSEDDCALGAICWDVSPATLEGACIPLCVGTPERPSCEDSDRICRIERDGVTPACHAVCDPLLQACPEGEGCYPVPPDWECAPDASGDAGTYGDPCDAINACDPGLACLDPNTVPPGQPCEAAAGCCTPLCDFSDPDASLQCPGAAGGQVCLPWYPVGRAPAGFEDVGVCSLWP